MIAGGELLVRGASNIAAAARVSPLIIGLTVVAFGTSAPELAVSIKSCYVGKTDLAVGNAVGSNISNLMLILGISAMAAPLAVRRRLFRLDIPVMIVAAIVLFACGWDGTLNRTEGAACFLGLVGYMIFTVAQGRRESAIANAETTIAELEITYDPAKSSAWEMTMNVVKLSIGLAMLVYGADWLVQTCVELATLAGLSELVIGLTVVAIGTSLPELVTSLMASLKGERDLAVGNVVGSNILNILLVLGLSAVVAPAGINVDPQSMVFDIPVLIGFSVAATFVFLSGMMISRIEGLVMLIYYAAYLGYLLWHAANRPGAITPWWETAWFLAPLIPLLLLSRWLARRATNNTT